MYCHERGKFFGHVGNWLDKKRGVNLKYYEVTIYFTNYYMNLSKNYNNVRFVKDRVLQGKRDCKAIEITIWDLSKSLCGVSGDKAPPPPPNIFKAIKRLAVALKNYILALRSYTSS